MSSKHTANESTTPETDRFATITPAPNADVCGVSGCQRSERVWHVTLHEIDVTRVVCRYHRKHLLEGGGVA